jgi:hypothetical protein
MKFIIEETVNTTYTYFHEVEANTEEEAREKFCNDEDVEYHIRDPYYGDDAIFEIYEKR